MFRLIRLNAADALFRAAPRVDDTSQAAVKYQTVIHLALSVKAVDSKEEKLRNSLQDQDA